MLDEGNAGLVGDVHALLQIGQAKLSKMVGRHHRREAMSVVIAGEQDIGTHLRGTLQHPSLVVGDHPGQPVNKVGIGDIVHQQLVHPAQIVAELKAVVAQEDNRLLTFEALDCCLQTIQPVVGIGVGWLIVCQISFVAEGMAHRIRYARRGCAPDDPPFIANGILVNLLSGPPVFKDGNGVEVLGLAEIQIADVAVQCFNDGPINDQLPQWHAIGLLATQGCHKSLLSGHFSLPGYATGNLCRDRRGRGAARQGHHRRSARWGR